MLAVEDKRHEYVYKIELRVSIVAERAEDAEDRVNLIAQNLERHFEVKDPVLEYVD